MSNKNHARRFLEGAETWNSWRTQNPTEAIDLTSFNFARARGVRSARDESEYYIHVQSDEEPVNLVGQLANMDLSNVDLSGSNFSFSRLLNCDLSGANLTDAVWEGAVFSECNLTNANLEGAKLSRSFFSGSNLSRANLGDSDLSGAKLAQSDFHSVEFSRTRMKGAQIWKSSFEEAVLVGVDFSFARLDDVNFNRAKMRAATFSSNDLSRCTYLETVFHSGPSLVPIDVLHASSGKIPSVFLKGCGYYDIDIEFAKLTNPNLNSNEVTDILYKIHEHKNGKALAFYSCFISHSSGDKPFAHKLHEDLRKYNIRSWFAPEDMKIGDRIRPTIDEQIRKRDKLIVVLSESSIKSEWVGDEVETALDQEKKEGRTILFPIMLDHSVMETEKDWASKIRLRRHIGDFSDWQAPGAYKQSFDRLLNNLRAVQID